MLAFVLVVVGLALAGWGAWAATRAERPLDLVAAIAAPVGVLVATAGAVGLAVPGFL